jgi:hypothetical protein
MMMIVWLVILMLALIWQLQASPYSLILSWPTTNKTARTVATIALSEPGDKPPAKSCPAEDGQQPFEGDRQPFDKEPSESITPLRKRRKAPVKDSTVLLNNSEDLALLSSHLYMSRPNPLM